MQWLRAENEYQKTCRPWYWKTSDASAENTGSSNAEAKTFSGYSSFHHSTAPYNLLLSSEADEPPRLAKAICHENKGSMVIAAFQQNSTTAIFSESQDCPAAHEGAELGLL
ncbi:hypothetical protein CLOSTMETH_00651, partial [[Clostridium] methylpentosum DSM 5476]